ncbi:MAG: FGGY-family carbohydrate kinase [Pseudomonadota bacterium]
MGPAHSRHPALMNPAASDALYLGIDIGTSGCRAMAIDEGGALHGDARVPLPEPTREGACVAQDPALWWDALAALLDTLFRDIPAGRIRSLAVDGTSSTLLLTDKLGTALSPALMYNDARAVAEAERIARIAPRETAAHGPSCGLAKLLWMQRTYPGEHVAHALHQADWISGRLCGRFGISDSNNCLKLGYDPVSRQWPGWLGQTGAYKDWLPRVVEPGSVLGPVTREIATRFGFSSHTQVVAGTTDSTAAFIATGAHEPGEAVTSLGSTLVMKVISQRPIFAPEYGIYSQPLGDLWLAGGGSNSGGAVLRQFFSNEQLRELSQRIDPARSSGLDYYPLPAPGERFPVCDPHLAPRLTPRPADDAAFLHGLFEGMARIEQMAYQRLAELGAPYPSSIRSAGGGAQNPAWRTIRARLLEAPLIEATQQEAAYGSALLARRPFTGEQ